MVWLKISIESIILAIKELLSNKFRAFLSLLGISIAILCLISVFAAVDSLEKNLRSSVDSLGSNIIYINKWPWLMVEDYPWWKFVQRPEVSREDYFALNGNVKTAEALALWRWVQMATVQYKDNQLEEISIFGVTKDYIKVRDMSFSAGRYFSDLEFNSTQNGVLIGHEIAEFFFDTPQKAIGKKIKYAGIELKVVGVMAKEGQDVLGINANFGLDNTMYITDKFADSNLNPPFESGPSILAKAKPGVSLEELEAELVGRMRIARKLSPKQDDNFSLNKISLITGVFDQVFSFIYVAGFVIGIFSLIVGAFGVANIMFVSVRERTNIIGIKKALGAKKIYILLEFIIEAIILCLVGGLLGLFAVFSLFFIINIAMQGSELNFQISLFNLGLGLFISISVGLLAGIIPAVMAANMKPVDAIRS
ncbi:MAG: ABC transporter permease [Bacteroidetes bacterium]|nr:ABC transporter permease [Bacteroidota bacterium]MCB9226460.1 ABC transporter permease [Chitinophagales bacterium]